MVRATVNGLIEDRSLSEVVRQALSTLMAELDDLRRANLRQATRLRVLDDDLRNAALVQRDLLPATLPHVRGLKIETLFRPAGAISGDFYDVRRLDSSHVGFWVCDATGHGVSAGLVASFVKGAFRRCAEVTPLDVARVLAEVNSELLTANFSECQFATAVYGVYDEQSRRIQLARAGSPHPLLMKRTTESATVACAGPMLGVSPAAPADFGVAECELSRGEALLIYTDGTEVLPNFLEPRGLDAAPFDSRRLLDSIDRELAEHADDPQRDDLTILTLQAL